MALKKICVFCGANPGKNPLYIEQANALGSILAKKEIQLVYGGASVGLMGRIADSCLENGGTVFGVIPGFLDKAEISHKKIQELKIVNSMHERKLLMYDRADAFLILPGGIGTMDEFFEVFTWRQLQLHHKPIGILNIGKFFDPLLVMLHKMVDEEFLRVSHMDYIFVREKIETLLDELESAARLDPERENENKF